MALQTEFVEIALADLRREAAIMKSSGWRFMQTHAVYADDAVDLYYSFMKGGLARNLKVKGVTKGDAVPSITDMFLAAFVFENEARELFGVDMRDIALDFQGALYAPAEAEPMRFITPEQKAAREKAAKAAAAKATKPEGQAEAASAVGAVAAGKRRIFVMTPELQARLDKKLPTMSPDKVAKVEAALAARKAEAEAAAQADAQGSASSAQQTAGKETAGAVDSKDEKAAPSAVPATDAAPKRDAVLEKKLAAMDPAKAAKVRAALAGAAGASKSGDAASAGENAPATAVDALLEAKIAAMDPDKAAKVRAALAAKGGK